jgi:hypothetical protein
MWALNHKNNDAERFSTHNVMVLQHDGHCLIFNVARTNLCFQSLNETYNDVKNW